MSSTSNCCRRIAFWRAEDSCRPKQNGPNGAGGAELGPQADDRSRRERVAASLSVLAEAFGSRAAISGAFVRDAEKGSPIRIIFRQRCNDV